MFRITFFDVEFQRLIDGTALAPSPKPPSPPNYDSFATTRSANFDSRKSFAGESGTESDVEEAKNGGKSDDLIAASGRSVERAVGCRDDSCFEVNFDGN